MSVLRPGFSERVFEFSFNAEYAARNRAVLAGAPHIPTQNEEKSLGYDVAFELNRRGGAVHSVALQHKVSRFVDGLGPKNHDFWSESGGPYFAFQLDTDQYNLIEGIASSGLHGVECYFCAPMFATRTEMNSRYLANAVEPSSVWIDVKDAGTITDEGPHSIVYSADGKQAFRFSEDAVPLKVLGDEARRAKRAERKAADLQSIVPIYETAFGVLKGYWPSRRRTKGLDADNAIRVPKKLPARKEPTPRNTAELLSQYYGLSWLIEGQHEPN